MTVTCPQTRRPIHLAEPPLSPEPNPSSPLMDDGAAPAAAAAAELPSPSPSSSGASPSPRSKRRRTDRYAQGFEFARAAPRPRPRPRPLRRRRPRAARPSGRRAPPSRSSTPGATASCAPAAAASARTSGWRSPPRRRRGLRPGYYSEQQCRNRIDTLRKKYRKEKERMRLAARRPTAPTAPRLPSGSTSTRCSLSCAHRRSRCSHP